MDTRMWRVVDNKKLKELAEKAGMQPYYDDQEKQMERFMDAVVRECTSYMDKYTRIHVLKHFGLPEELPEVLEVTPGLSVMEVEGPELQQYVVLYRLDRNDLGSEVFAFECMADNMDHAEEQFSDAYPDDRFPDYDLLWVYNVDKDSGKNPRDAALDDYYGNE